MSQPDLSQLLTRALAFDEKGYREEAKRYSFEYGGETRDDEHLSTMEVHAALLHLVKFESVRIQPLMQKLIAVAVEAQKATYGANLLLCADNEDQVANHFLGLDKALAQLREALSKPGASGDE